MEVHLMDAGQIWQAIQPYLAPILAGITALVVAAIGLVVIALRSLGHRITQQTDAQAVAVERSEVEVEREKFYLKVTQETFNRVEKLEGQLEESRLLLARKDAEYRDLNQRLQETEDSLAILRGQREEQNKELIRLNEKVKALEAQILKLETEKAKLENALKAEQDARERAEKAREIAENAHVMERESLTAEIRALNEKLEQMQSRLGTMELAQTQEDKGVSPQ